MILVVAPETGEVLTMKDLRAMRLPARHGWEAWISQDEKTGVTKKFSSFAAALASEGKHPRRRKRKS